MGEHHFYKMYQVAGQLMKQHGFTQQFIQQYSSFLEVELWLMNLSDPDYQLIRVTTNKASVFHYDQERVDTIIKGISALHKTDLSFLDIHICNEVYDKEYEKLAGI